MLALVVAVLVGFAQPAAAAPAKLECGAAALYGHQVPVVAKGKRVRNGRLTCERVARITDGNCRIRFRKEWSCFSFQAPYPFLVWWPSRETFKFEYSTVIEYWRYRCSEAVVTPELFQRPLKGFPTQRQMLADDVIRCSLLDGQPKDEIAALLGQPDERGKRYSSYVLGDERDSYFQIDAEILRVSWDRDGIVRSVDTWQS